MRYLNTKLLRGKEACDAGYFTFKNAHGDGDVTWVQAFESNGWGDIWWAISVFSEELTLSQLKDLRLLAADYAERVLPIFEKELPNDDRPRLAIRAVRDFANDLISESDLNTAAEAAVWAAARAAAEAAEAVWAAARAAAEAAGAAARAAAEAAVWAAEAAEAAARAAAVAAEAAEAAGAAERKHQEELLVEMLTRWSE